MQGNKQQQRQLRKEKAAIKRAGARKRRRALERSLREDPEDTADRDDWRFNDRITTRDMNAQFVDGKRSRG